MIKRVVVTRAAENIIAGNSMILKKSMVRKIESLINDFNNWRNQMEYDHMAFDPIKYTSEIINQL